MPGDWGHPWGAKPFTVKVVFPIDAWKMREDQVRLLACKGNEVWKSAREDERLREINEPGAVAMPTWPALDHPSAVIQIDNWEETMYRLHAATLAAHFIVSQNGRHTWDLLDIDGISHPCCGKLMTL